MSQHAGLGEERWASFTLDQQVLMIGNEINRARKLTAEADRGRRRRALERALRLTDLTVQVQERHGLRRELLRWRDLVAELYLEEVPRSGADAAALASLLRLTRTASVQIPLLLDAGS